MPTEPQTTLAHPVTLHGRGIHSGTDCQLTVRPAGADHGIRFIRTDLGRAPEIRADLTALSREPLTRRTILCSVQDKAVSVETVEHVLAALHGLGIDNARIEMTAPEPPIGDGSARQLTHALVEAGTKALSGAERRTFQVERPVSFRPADSPGVEFSAWPSEFLTATYFLEYDHPVIGSQSASFRVSPEVFAQEIAPARTFCTDEEVELLRSRGLIRGGSIDNAIVIGREGVLNTQLHWGNELARHKLLDLIGDLFLLGLPVRGHVLAYRGGHGANAQFIDHLRKEFTPK